MPRLVAFLRAVNVGGRHVVSMTELRAVFVDAGLRDVETFIASGNVIFTAPSGSLAALGGKIERHLQTSLGFEVRTFLRTAPEVAAIARYRPFAAAATKQAAALNVALLAAPLSAAACRTLASFRNDIDEFHVNGREVYWLCRRKQSESKFSNARFEKALGVASTLRGKAMIERLAAKYCSSQKIRRPEDVTQD